MFPFVIRKHTQIKMNNMYTHFPNKKRKQIRKTLHTNYCGMLANAKKYVIMRQINTNNAGTVTAVILGVIFRLCTPQVSRIFVGVHG